MIGILCSSTMAAVHRRDPNLIFIANAAAKFGLTSKHKNGSLYIGIIDRFPVRIGPKLERWTFDDAIDVVGAFVDVKVPGLPQGLRTTRRRFVKGRWRALECRTGQAVYIRASDMSILDSYLAASERVGRLCRVPNIRRSGFRIKVSGHSSPTGVRRGIRCAGRTSSSRQRVPPDIAKPLCVKGGVFGRALLGRRSRPGCRFGDGSGVTERAVRLTSRSCSRQIGDSTARPSRT